MEGEGYNGYNEGRRVIEGRKGVIEGGGYNGGRRVIEGRKEDIMEGGG